MNFHATDGEYLESSRILTLKEIIIEITNLYMMIKKITVQ